MTTTAVPPWWGRGAHARCILSLPPSNPNLRFPSRSSQRGRRGHVGGARIAAGFGARGACTRVLLVHGCMQRMAVCTAMCANGCCMCASVPWVPARMQCALVQWVPAQLQCENRHRCKRCLRKCSAHVCISAMDACLWATCMSAVHKGRHPMCTCASMQWLPARMHAWVHCTDAHCNRQAPSVHQCNGHTHSHAMVHRCASRSVKHLTNNARQLKLPFLISRCLPRP